MRRYLFALLLMMLVPATSTAKQTDEEKLNAGWILRDITIQEPAAEGEPSWANVRVQAVIDAEPRAVWNALVDLKSWPRWLPMSQKAHFLSPEAEALITPENSEDQQKVLQIDSAHPAADQGNNFSGMWKRMVYEEYNLPWPIKNEWVVRNYTYDETKSRSKASWRKVSSKSEDVDGFWEVTTWKDGKTLLKYYYRVKAKESVPKPVFKAAVTLTVNSMIKALKHEAEKREDQLASQR